MNVNPGTSGLAQNIELKTLEINVSEELNTLEVVNIASCSQNEY